jgi:Flp pilus assembly protein CpaB
MLLVIALGFAFVSGQSLASAEVREQQREANLMTVLVARKDVPSLVFLSKPMEYFQEKGIPYEAVPRGACHSFDDIKDQMLLRRIAKGEAITQDHFRKPAKDTFPIEVPSGQIPFTIRVSPDFLGGNPRPLARVNVVLVFRDDDRKAKSIVERAMILAWDTDNAADEKGGSDNLIGGIVNSCG